MKNNEIRDLIKLLQNELRWCGGSPDFLPGGQAMVGWQRGPEPAIAEADKALKEIPCDNYFPASEAVLSCANCGIAETKHEG